MNLYTLSPTEAKFLFNAFSTYIWLMMFKDFFYAKVIELREQKINHPFEKPGIENIPIPPAVYFDWELMS